MAAAAALAAVWLMPSGAGLSRESELEIALAPSDPAAREFVLSAAPPDISTLLPFHQEGSR